MREDSDSSEPSANSTAMRNLIVLDAIVHATYPMQLGIATVVADDYEDRVAKLLDAFGYALMEHPKSLPDMVSSVTVRERGFKSVIISGEGYVIAFIDGISKRRWMPAKHLVRERAGGRTIDREGVRWRYLWYEVDGCLGCVDGTELQQLIVIL